jgi:hypothetical protein
MGRGVGRAEHNLASGYGARYPLCCGAWCSLLLFYCSTNILCACEKKKGRWMEISHPPPPPQTLTRWPPFPGDCIRRKGAEQGCFCSASPLAAVRGIRKTIRYTRSTFCSFHLGIRQHVTFTRTTQAPALCLRSWRRRRPPARATPATWCRQECKKIPAGGNGVCHSPACSEHLRLPRAAAGAMDLSARLSASPALNTHASARTWSKSEAADDFFLCLGQHFFLSLLCSLWSYSLSAR